MREFERMDRNEKEDIERMKICNNAKEQKD